MVMLATLAGLGASLAGEAAADVKNLSCITEDSPIEHRVIRDCGNFQPPVYEPAVEVVVPPPPPEPAKFVGDRGGKSGERSGRDREPKGGGGSQGGNSGGGNSGGGAGSAAN
jgi:uncharacterized membrane protein YgcG